METGRHWFESPSLQVCSFAELVMDAPQAGLDITRCNEQMTCAGLGFCRAWWCKEGPCSVSGNSFRRNQDMDSKPTTTPSCPSSPSHIFPLPYCQNAFCIFASLHRFKSFWIIFPLPDISFDPFGRVLIARILFGLSPIGGALHGEIAWQCLASTLKQPDWDAATNPRWCL